MRRLYPTFFFLLATFGWAVAAFVTYWVLTLAPESSGLSLSGYARIVDDVRLPLDFTIVGVFVGAVLLFVAEHKEKHFARSKEFLRWSGPILSERLVYFGIYALGSVSLSFVFADSYALEPSPFVTSSVLLSIATVCALSLAPAGWARRYALGPIIVMAAVGVFDLVENKTVDHSFYVAPEQYESIEF